ncbi:hypothetical protein [Novosphingobium sp.]|uniref:hypothetical protein n=1 Tax=Novosphingobium sp. TaxID=1874826 RepID=UPI002FE38BBD
MSRPARGSGARARARAARKIAFARRHGLTPSRGARFAMRGAPSPSLGEIAFWPSWPGLDEKTQQDVFALTALLSARDALGEIISGSELRAYAEPFGADLFERALSLDGTGMHRLVPAQHLSGEGEQLARCGLPATLARCLGESVAAAPDAARHVAEAEGLLRL